MTKTNRAWKKIFEEKNIKRHLQKDGFYKISSREIGKYREARLMAKFDHQSSLPDLFKQEGISILPTKRGEYILSNFKAYETINDSSKPDIIYIPKAKHIKSIDPQDIFSESISLNYAYLSGIFHDFLGVNEIYHTLSGRMGSSKFDFHIKNTLKNESVSVVVENAQIEIDGGYETKDTLYLVEAKNSLPSDFLIRQLYYPYRLWHDKFKSHNIDKDVSTIFLTYSNDIWDLYEYQFIDFQDYNSLRLVKHKRYMIQPQKITIDEIKRLIQETPQVSEPEGIPYPQANSFERVINLLEILTKQGLSKEAIYLDFNTNSLDKRQVDYYLNACRYLGLLKTEKINGESIYSLNSQGKKIMSMDFKRKNLSLAQEILKYPSFNQAASLHLDNKMNSGSVVRVMEESQVYNVTSSSTYRRRASTVQAWIHWIFNLIDF